MQLRFDTIYKNIDNIIKGSTIDLSDVDFIHPWPLVIICLLMVERHKNPDKELILPKNPDVLDYLKRIHFCDMLRELGYDKEFNSLNKIVKPESYNLNVQEIMHCNISDEFNARLGHINLMFQNFGLNKDQANFATNIVAELGNNVFDHNSGNWPTDIGGCFIVAQNFPTEKQIEVAVGDPGIGFLGSLRARFPHINDDVEAIKLGLRGNTGRIGEDRGNGLGFVQRWTIDDLYGNLMIHSGNGLVEIGKNGIKKSNVNKILGTIAQFVI